MEKREVVVKLDIAVLRENLGLTESQLPDDASTAEIQRLLNTWIYRGERAVQQRWRRREEGTTSNA